jgi:hypothetical protein
MRGVPARLEGGSGRGGSGRERAWAERGEAGGAGPSWAGPFGLEEEVGRAGLFSGFLGWFSFSNSNSISYF